MQLQSLKDKNLKDKQAKEMRGQPTKIEGQRNKSRVHKSSKS